MQSELRLSGVKLLIVKVIIQGLQRQIVPRFAFLQSRVSVVE